MPVPITRKLLAAAAAAGILAAAAGTAWADSSLQDTIQGLEVYTSGSTADFAGTAQGALPGYWFAAVQHSPDALTTGQNMTVTGGSFTLSGPKGLLTASGVTGVVQGKAVAGCPRSVSFPVSLSLSGVQLNEQPVSGATFSGALVHYYTTLFGSCLPYAAVLQGTLAVGA